MRQEPMTRFGAQRKVDEHESSLYKLSQSMHKSEHVHWQSFFISAAL